MEGICYFTIVRSVHAQCQKLFQYVLDREHPMCIKNHIMSCKHIVDLTNHNVFHLFLNSYLIELSSHLSNRQNMLDKYVSAKPQVS